MQIPSLNGNWVDLVIIIFLVSFIFSGIDRGFLINFIDLTGFLLSFIVALKFYPFAASFIVANFSIPIGIANALGFIILGFLTETIFFIIIRLLYPSIPAVFTKSKVNKILGPIPAIVNGLVVVAFFLSVVTATPIQPKIKNAIFASKLGSPLIAKTQNIEQELGRVFGEAVLETLSFITIKPESSEKIDLQFTLSQVAIDEKGEEEMLVLVNKERQSAGVSILLNNDKLKEIARNHAKDMFKRGYFSHINPDGQSPFDRLEVNNVTFQAAGENLAFAPTVTLAHQGLMQSPGHKKNILSSDFGRVGIGVIDGGAYGRMFVQLFTD